MEAIIAQQPAAVAGTITSSLFNDYVSFIDRSKATTRTYLINLRQFMAYLKHNLIINPIRQDVINYRDWLQSEHEAIQITEAGTIEYRTDSAGNRLMIKCKAATVAQYLRSVCQFFRWTASNGLYPNIAENIHAPKIDGSTHKKEALTALEVTAIEASIKAAAEQRTEAAADRRKDTAGRVQRSTEQGKRLYAMYMLAVNCGLRTIELSRACIKDIETKGGKSCIYIWGKGRSEPDAKKTLAPEVKAAIDDYLASRTDRPTGGSPLFTSTGNRSHGKRIAPTTISTMLKKAMKEAGFNSDRLTAHSLRHTCGDSVMQITGNNIYTTQSYMRHSSPKTTEIYLHRNAEEVESGIAESLYNFYHNRQPQGGGNLEAAIAGLTADQINQITTIANAMKGK